MTDENKLQDTFAEACDKLNDAYVFCQKELQKLRRDNDNLLLDVFYLEKLLKKCKKFVNNELKKQIEEAIK